MLAFKSATFSFSGWANSAFNLSVIWYSSTNSTLSWLKLEWAKWRGLLVSSNKCSCWLSSFWCGAAINVSNWFSKDVDIIGSTWSVWKLTCEKSAIANFWILVISSGCVLLSKITSCISKLSVFGGVTIKLVGTSSLVLTSTASALWSKMGFRAIWGFGRSEWSIGCIWCLSS